ncbi:hypothetical protein AAA799D11_01055, partial [Marine Group I thaumarchaeote SCGC AAA799-D11]
KPYSDETRNDIVEKYLLGESVREIHDSTGVSTGSISEYINDFASKIERKTIDAIHDFFKIIRKNGMQPKDAFYGHVVFSILLKHNLDPKQIHSFVKSVLSMAKQNELSAEHLMGLCNTVSTIQSKSDIPLHEIENHCTELAKTKDELELSIDKLSSQHKQSQNNLSALLKKNKLTEQQDKSVDLRLREKQSKLDDVEKRTHKLEKKHEELSLMHENLLLRHKSVVESVDSVEYLIKSGVLEKDIVYWQKIFDTFGLTPADFLAELEKAGNAKKLFRKLNSTNTKLKKECESLEKKKSWLEDKSEELSSEISNGAEFGKKNLKKITDHAELQINNAVTLTKKSLVTFMKQNQIQMNLAQKQYKEYFSDLVSKLENLLEHSHQAEYSLSKMESLKPLLDLLNDKFDSATSISEIMIILDKLYVNIKDTDLDKHNVSSDIKRLREKLLDLISHA